MTPQQLATLKADILVNFADPQQWPNTPDGNFAVAAAYNATAAPSFTVWKSSASLAAVGDAFNGAELGNLSTINTSRLQAIAAFFMQRGVNPSRADTRQMFDDIFSTGGVTKAALLALWKRFATRAEKLFATGTGTDVSPATLVFEGNVTGSDVLTARNLP